MKFSLIGFSLLLAFNASAFEFSGKVVGVSDGDTITVLYGKKYHRDGCNSLSKSKFVTLLSKAKAACYAPCKSCNPPH